MKKSLITMLLCLFVFCTSSCGTADVQNESVPENKEEIETVALQSSCLDNEGMPWEKIGDYYIGLKITTDENGNIQSEELLAYEDLSSPESIWTNDTSDNIGDTLISDGKDIFFSVSNPFSESMNRGGSVYRISISNHTTEKIADIPDMNNLVAYYDDTVFYQRYSDTQLNTISLYKYELDSNESSCVEEDFTVDSQYGNMLIGAPTRHNPNVTYYCYNMDSGEKTQLVDAFSASITNDKVYYSSYGEDMSSTVVGYCSFDGTDNHTIATVANSDSFFTGRNSAMALDSEGILKSINYENGKVSNQSFPVEKRIVGSWENLEYTSMSDYISIIFYDDGKVECTFPRDVLEGRYSVKDNEVSISLNSGKSYSNVDGQWTTNESINLEIDGVVNYNSIDITVHDTSVWNATLTRLF